MNVLPLIFEPIFKPKMWGGRRLETLLGKKLPPGVPIGESWELADLEDNQTIVGRGPARGKTLGQLVNDWGAELVGGATLVDERFPLLIKFLDAKQSLSIQVHPNEAMVREQGGRVGIKNEAWYILDAHDDGHIYRGVQDGVDARCLQDAIENQRIETVLRRIKVKKGHCYYLPSGTIHALGAGVMVAEVQTPSDTTYRVFDWNRCDPTTNKPRDLHLEQALRCISYDTGLIEEERKQHIASVWTSVTRLVHCPSFTIERVRMVAGVEQPIPHAEMVIWMMLEGQAEIAYDGADSPLACSLGETVLIPAGLKDGIIKTDDGCMWLEVTAPVPSSLMGFPRPPREQGLADSSPESIVTLNIEVKRSKGEANETDARRGIDGEN